MSFDLPNTCYLKEMIRPFSDTAADQIDVNQRHDDHVRGLRPGESYKRLWLEHGKLVCYGLVETIQRFVVELFIGLFQLCKGQFREAGHTFTVRWLGGTVVSACATVAAIVWFFVAYPIVGTFRLPIGVELAADKIMHMKGDLFYEPPKDLNYYIEDDAEYF